MSARISVTLETARRVAVQKQLLAGRPRAATRKGLLETARQIRCIQVDPIAHVARTQHLVCFSRLGPRYKPKLLDDATYKHKDLFHYWAHAASLVLTEDFPIHSVTMRNWARRGTPGGARVQRFLEENAALKRQILKRLRSDGPLRARDFEVGTAQSWESTGWTGGQTVSRMLDFLWIQGKITIVGRQGIERVWALADDYFPPSTPRERLSEREMVKRATTLSLNALGIATQKQISQHFTRNAYPGLGKVLDEFDRSGEVVGVAVTDDGSALKGKWFALAADVPLIEKLSKTEFEGRTTLLSPFDNLICDRARTQQLFDFDYKIEIYVPAAKRRYGYYVLPILHGGRLIGRVDSRFDRARSAYVVDRVYAERTANRDKRTAAAVRQALDDVAGWLGADSIEIGSADAWSSALGARRSARKVAG